MDKATFWNELLGIRGRYQHTLTDLDHGVILAEGLKAYERAASGVSPQECSALKKTLEDFLLLRVAALLPPAAYKDFTRELVQFGNRGGVTCR